MIDDDKEVCQRSGHYQLYGIQLWSCYPFYSNLFPWFSRANSPGIVFACNNLPPFSIDWQEQEKIYTSPNLTVDGKSFISFYQFGECIVIRFFDAIDYYLWPDRIDCHSRQSFPNPVIEDYLFGPVMALWLESHGTPVLHASAISIDSQAVAFLANSRCGKSTLAAAFLQAGQTLLTDDILPLAEQQQRFWGHSGLPQINLWPDQANYFTSDLPDLASTVPESSKKHVPIGVNGFGAFCSRSQPLGCVYLPRRQPAKDGLKVEITPLGPAEAVFALARFSFMANAVQSFGWQERRLDFFVRLVQQVPVRRICYPDGFEHVDRVTDSILEDLKNLPGVSGPAR